MRIVFAGGGTGGHLFPGIALAQALVQREPSAEPYFLCTDRPIDARQLTRYGFAHRVLHGQRFAGIRRGGLAAVPALMRAYHAAWKVVLGLAPAAVVGLGGYGMVGPSLTAYWNGIPLLVLEQNVIPGKAVKLCARLAHKVCGQWDVTAGRFARRPGLYEATGNPLRQELVPVPRVEALRELGLAPERKTLLVMGGSQGAQGVDRIVLRHGAGLKDFAGQVQVVHLCGAENEEKLRVFYAQAGVTAKVLTFSDRMQVLYSAADLAIGRSGATALAELTAFGIPMILVPYPHAAENHQMINALEAAKHKAAFCQPERDWNEGWFRNYLETLLLDDRRRQEFARHSRSLGRPRAASVVTERLLAIATKNPVPRGAVS